MIGETFTRIVNFFAPEELYGTAQAHYRARMAVVFQLFVLATLMVFAAFHLGSKPWISRSTLMMFAINVPMGLTILAMLYKGRRRPRAVQCAHQLLAFGWLCTLGTIHMTGGVFTSAAIYVLLILPIVGALVGGRRGGARWGQVALASLIALGVVEHLWWPAFPLSPEMSAGEQMVGIWCYVFSVAVGSAVISQNMSAQLQHALERERERLQQLALHDPLTGLANRLLFTESLEQALARSRRSHQQVLLAYIDLNEFKPINDQYGHHAGDLVLQEFGQRLRRSVRSGDVAARLGGDEFAVIMEGVPESDLPPLLALLQERLNQSVYLADIELPLSASIGISAFHGEEWGIEELMRRADQAMYRAKQSRRPLEWFSPLKGTSYA